MKYRSGHSKRKNKNRLFKYILFGIVFFLVAISILYWYMNIYDQNEKNWHRDSNSNIYYETNGGERLTGWQKINGRIYCFNEDGTLQKSMKAIDVSKYQKDINWDAVYAQGIRLAMIRSSYGYKLYPQQIDSKFKENIDNAQKAGLKVGVYHYCYAMNVEEAKKEAQFCLKAIKGYDIQLPVAYDIEEDEHKSLSKEELTDMAVTFCEEIKKAGYIPMIYSYIDFMESKFDYKRISKYDLWVAQYTPECTYKNNYTMWQYTETGLLDGIEKEVDFNYYYFVSTINKYKKKVIY